MKIREAKREDAAVILQLIKDLALYEMTPVGERAMAISIRLFGNRMGQFLVPLAAGALAAPFGASSVFIGLGVLVASAGAVSAATLDDKTA